MLARSAFAHTVFKSCGRVLQPQLQHVHTQRHTSYLFTSSDIVRASHLFYSVDFKNVRWNRTKHRFGFCCYGCFLCMFFSFVSLCLVCLHGINSFLATFSIPGSSFVVLRKQRPAVTVKTSPSLIFCHKTSIVFFSSSSSSTSFSPIPNDTRLQASR